MRLSATKVSSDFDYVRFASQLGQGNIVFCVFGWDQPFSVWDFDFVWFLWWDFDLA